MTLLNLRKKYSSGVLSPRFPYSLAASPVNPRGASPYAAPNLKESSNRALLLACSSPITESRDRANSPFSTARKTPRLPSPPSPSPLLPTSSRSPVPSELSPSSKQKPPPPPDRTSPHPPHAAGPFPLMMGGRGRGRGWFGGWWKDGVVDEEEVESERVVVVVLVVASCWEVLVSSTDEDVVVVVLVRGGTGVGSMGGIGCGVSLPLTSEDFEFFSHLLVLLGERVDPAVDGC
ncbi:hypothetical protein KC331_g73 [Hortaea werneckii]|nr:hypothetical protein KC331_g73 [Hortaea werneckii]